MRSICSLLLVCFLSSCGFSPEQIDPGKISSINIIDRNGLTETVSSKERLAAYEHTDFLAPQPYQKVMRVYGREKTGDIRACITSYHPNGQVKQYLEALNNRASGSYREWYPDGQIKIDATVIGGVADLNTQAEASWLFDGINRAWDEEGNLAAEIPYNKGELEGEALYFHPNGRVWKKIPYQKDKIEGTQRIFLQDGTLFQSTDYAQNAPHGSSYRYWSPNKLTFEEKYVKGKLLEGRYFNSQGKCISQVREGSGFRAIFGKNRLQELHEYKRGVQAGRVEVYRFDGTLARTYAIKDGEKHGEELEYFPNSEQPKLLMTWYEGRLQGPAKTWYENGGIESQREISGNKKNGLLTSWYRNGALMLVEEYENDHLLKGEYYRCGERAPVSKIEKGKGIATLFAPNGNFSRKVYYQDGKPIE